MSNANRTSEELKPCPFCGGEAVAIATRPERGMVCCRKCGASTDPDEEMTKDELLAAWNTRAAVTDEQFAMAVHDGRVWQVVRECHMEIQDCIDPEGNVFHFVCSECRRDVFGSVSIAYCSNCGAKVVAK